MASRTREELLAIIEGGESVLMPDGNVIHKGNAHELPDAVTLAGDDIVQRQHAIGDLEAQRKAIDASLAKIKADEAEKKAAAEAAILAEAELAEAEKKAAASEPPAAEAFVTVNPAASKNGK